MVVVPLFVAVEVYVVDDRTLSSHLAISGKTGNGTLVERGYRRIRDSFIFGIAFIGILKSGEIKKCYR
eukprot:scaffold165713_cov28-Attheya_sp.AAC.1